MSTAVVRCPADGVDATSASTTDKVWPIERLKCRSWHGNLVVLDAAAGKMCWPWIVLRLRARPRPGVVPVAGPQTARLLRSGEGDDIYVVTAGSAGSVLLAAG